MANKKSSKKAKAEGTVLSVLAERRSGYETTKAEDGRRLVDCGDDVATQLRGLDLDGVYRAVAKAIGTPEKELRAKYSHLNPGMQRMNLGNRLRGAANGKDESPKAKAKATKGKAKAKTRKAKASPKAEEAAA